MTANLTEIKKELKRKTMGNCMPINRLDNLDEMDKSLERQRLEKLTQLEYKTMTRDESELIIKNYPQRKAEVQMTTLLNSNKYFKKD